jgi:hypothetical protein
LEQAEAALASLGRTVEIHVGQRFGDMSMYRLATEIEAPAERIGELDKSVSRLL